MYKHLEDQFPGREKQLEQLGNVTFGVSLNNKKYITFLFTLFVY